MKKQIMILCITLLLCSTALAVGLTTEPKYPNPYKSLRAGCEFSTYNPDGSLRRTYPSSMGYMHMNHATGKEQCYLLTRRGTHVKPTATPSSPPPPVCTTTTEYYCNTGTLRGDECERTITEDPLCNWPYNLNRNMAWCERSHHSLKIPICNEGLRFSIVNHLGVCTGIIRTPAHESSTTTCN